ncbi:leucine-rich repeat and guanylate kinase domain-containing protein [Bombina bombina]|uniref:leucine-rich repeat and guanylate kinase domain-containing protein n=1 Tax=Bombina bombina TaxID=8345 RepID=UPI00235B00C8|nr:leucine-rich repeat and guanylate kinase domain-containing protein [Bombina bombina]
MAALAMLSPGLLEDFSLPDYPEIEGASGQGWESPEPDSYRELKEPLSDSESSQEGEEESETMFDAVLKEEMVAEGLSMLGRSALGTEYVFLNLTLSNRMLQSIQLLCKYIHLQKLDVSCNEITDLSCVSHMPYLTELKASNNKLTTFFDFAPPKNLQVVDLSFNLITDMKDLSVHKVLRTLILNNNKITEIKGLENCRSLSHLNLSHNQISSICDFGSLPIKTLCLGSNQIKNISGLDNLKNLQTLDLSGNRISSLEGLEGLDLLQNLHLEDNEICEISEISYIEELPLLHVLNLVKNPLQEQPEYWLSVLFMLQRLTELDLKKVKIEEKVAAVNKYDPPPEVIAARDHMAHVMYSVIQPQRVFDSTLPNYNTPYPMLVLTGPQSSGKRELVHRMCRGFKEFFRYGPCHTTRNPYFGEEKRFDYHFVTPEVFEDMTCSGQFLVTMKYSGHYYGLSREAVESVAREGLACCTHMEIEGVRSLKNSHFEPRYILLLPVNKERYEGWLRRKGLFTRPEIEVAVSRVDMYRKINENNPGFFDAVINTDDLDEAYTKLSLLIKEYLGLIEPTRSNQSVTREKASTDSGKSLSGSSPGAVGKLARMESTNDFLDAAARNYSARISAKVCAQKTPVEEASVQRRQQAARQALAMKTPSTYTQLFQRCPVTAPATLGTHRLLLDPASCSSMLPSGSNVTGDRSLALASPDTSSRESRASSGLSLVSSAGAFSTRRSSQQTPIINIHSPPEDKIEPLDLSGLGQGSESTPDQNSVGHTPDTPRLPSTDRSDHKASKSKASSSSRLSAHTSRPGSDTKPILPPIPSGRKKTK